GAPAFPRETRAHLIRLKPDETGNRRIVDARVRASEDGEDSLAVEVLVRTDESERGRFEAGVFRDGKLLAKEQGQLDPSGEGRASITVDARSVGATLEVRLLGSSDSLPADDSRHVLTRSNDYTRVVVVDGR